MSVMAVYGRGGDIIMSMQAADTIWKVTGERPQILVHEKYEQVAEAMVKIGMPVSGIRTLPFVCDKLDTLMFGSSIARWSNSLLSTVCDDVDIYNCCLSSIPSDVHISSYMQYMTGLVADIEDPWCPIPNNEYSHVGGSGSVVYHLGGSSESKFIHIDSNPFPEMISVIVGSMSDPFPDWADIDMRGMDIMSLCSKLSVADGCLGSDSMVTHLSSALGVPTVAIHFDTPSVVMSSRSHYVNASSILCKRGNMVTQSVIDILSNHMSI